MKARRTIIYLALACAVVVCSGGTAFAQDDAAPAVTTRFDAGYVSKYVWRGIPQTAEGAFQPSITLSHSSGLAYNLWASEDIDKGEFTEHDHTLSYSWSAGGTGMSAGYIYYAFPNTNYLSTSEVYASAAFAAPLSPTVSINYDIDEASGFYASLGGSHAWDLPDEVGSLALSAKLSLSSASYNKFWFGKDELALSDLYLSASVPLAIGRATLTPSLSYSTIIDGSLRDGLSAMGLKPDNFVGGLTMSYAF